MADESAFLRLPLELRNAIYRELAPPRHLYSCSWRVCPTPESCRYRHISSSVDPSMLLVNKQIKLEYEREVFRTAEVEVHIQANMACHMSYLWFGIPTNTITNIRHVVWNVTMIGSDVLDDMLGDRISSVRDRFFPAMTALKVRFQVNLCDIEDWPESSEQASEMLKRIDKFAKMFTDTFTNVKVETGFFVESELCELYLPTIPEHVNRDLDHAVNLASGVRRHKDNYLVYHAQLGQPEDTDTFHGLKLEFDSAGQMNRQLIEVFIEGQA